MLVQQSLFYIGYSGCTDKTPISKSSESVTERPIQRLLVLTDLHLSRKPWQVRKALSMGSSYDAVLIPGDMTNDGTPPQFDLLHQCITDILPNTPVLAVAGNHD